MSAFNADNIILISEKIATATANVEKVFISGNKVGYDLGFAEGYSEAAKLGGYLDGYENGKKDENDAFWEALQKSGTRTEYISAFRDTGFEYIRPKYKIAPTQRVSGQNVFYRCSNLKKIEAEYFDYSKKERGAYTSEGWYYTFALSPMLEEIEDIGMTPEDLFQSTFLNCTSLKKIARIRVDSQSTFSDTFRGCKALEDVTFEGEISNDISFKDCSKLSYESICNILACLSEDGSGKTLTLSKAAVDDAFEFLMGDGTPIEGSMTGIWEVAITPKQDAGWTITLA